MLEFQRELVTAAVDALTGSELAALRNQDTHWYRFLLNQGIKPALSMVDIVQGLVGQLAPLAPEGVEWTVSLCELGASATLPPSRTVYPAWVSGQGDSSPTALSFQAAEVVRRVAVACCSGATRAGWHAHMGASYADDDYAGTGLRADEGAGGSAPIMSSADAHARPSFWTYQRWQSLLGGQRGTVVHPPEPSGGYYNLSADDENDVFTVLQFAGTERHPYLYGDCLEEMRAIPSASVHLVLCDLPYGTTNNDWDSVIPLPELWAHYRRVLPPRASWC